MKLAVKSEGPVSSKRTPIKTLFGSLQYNHLLVPSGPKSINSSEAYLQCNLSQKMLTSKATGHSKLASHFRSGRPLKKKKEYLKGIKQANSKQIPYRLSLEEAREEEEEGSRRST